MNVFAASQPTGVNVSVNVKDGEAAKPQLPIPFLRIIPSADSLPHKH